MQGTIFNVMRFAVGDGPGLRTTAFLKGCPLGCWWCHNPESQALGPQLIVRAERCIGCGRCAKVCDLLESQAQATPDARPPRLATESRTPSCLPPAGCRACGRCAEVCPSQAREIAGTRVTPQELMRDISRDVIFYDQSGGGVTFSGGEPLCQPGFLIQCLLLCRDRGIRTAVDTSGHAPWDVLATVARETDLLLYDLKLMDTARHRLHTGVGNELILCNLSELSRLHERIIVRIPVIPGVNDDLENARHAAAFLRRETAITDVTLLGYHATGEAKYGRLGRTYLLPSLAPPSAEDLRALARVYAAAGLNVADPD